MEEGYTVVRMKKLLEEDMYSCCDFCCQATDTWLSAKPGLLGWGMIPNSYERCCRLKLNWCDEDGQMALVRNEMRFFLHSICI